VPLVNKDSMPLTVFLLFIEVAGNFLSLPLHPNQLWSPTSLLSNGYQVFFPWGMKLTTDLHLVPRLRMHGVIPLLPNTSCHGA
jgi:hypothetical protein